MRWDCRGSGCGGYWWRPRSVRVSVCVVYVRVRVHGERAETKEREVWWWCDSGETLWRCSLDIVILCALLLDKMLLGGSINRPIFCLFIPNCLDKSSSSSNNVYTSCVLFCIISQFSFTLFLSLIISFLFYFWFLNK